MRVTGYFHKGTLSQPQIRIIPDAVTIQSGTTYTCIVKGTIQTKQSVKRIYVDSFSNRNTYYQSDSTFIFTVTSTGIKDVGAFADMSYAKDGDWFDFTINGIYLYEGAYLNPPLVNSLDTKPDEGDIFLHKDGLNYPTYQLGTNVSQDNKYRKIMEFGYINNQINYFEFLINKHWNASSCQMFRIQLCVSGSGMGGWIYNCSMNVKTFSLQSPLPTYYVSKFYVSYLKAGYPFLSMKLTSNGGKNDWTVAPLVLSVRKPGGNIRFNPQNFNMGMTPIDDIGTVIKEVTPTEGF